jgi:hypothetical protein
VGAARIASKHGIGALHDINNKVSPFYHRHPNSAHYASNSVLLMPQMPQTAWYYHPDTFPVLDPESRWLYADSTGPFPTHHSTARVTALRGIYCGRIT